MGKRMGFVSLMWWQMYASGGMSDVQEEMS
jgi:hypothetical protein